jgi:hypothetical protein
MCQVFGGYSSRQVIRCVNVPVVGLPLVSRAGVNFARLCRTRHVVESSAREPLELATLQLVTRPVVPIDKTTDTVPCSSLSSAEDG